MDKTRIGASVEWLVLISLVAILTWLWWTDRLWIPVAGCAILGVAVILAVLIPATARDYGASE